MTHEEIIHLLDEINVLCRDNGHRFTDFSRLTVIEEKLKNSAYYCTKGDLCWIYSKKPLKEFKGKAIVVSSHVDCEQSISRCFSQLVGEEMLKGTYDNSITNTAILALMIDDSLPDNVIISFTGDEEVNSKGAIETFHTLHKNGIKFKAIVLDVTDEGWHEKADVSLENNFFTGNSNWGQKAIECLIQNAHSWCFVPEDKDDIPSTVPMENRIYREAEPDESWDYDEMNVKCFSLCLPIYGEMHSDAGVLCRKSSFFEYTKMLERICCL